MTLETFSKLPIAPAVVPKINAAVSHVAFQAGRGSVGMAAVTMWQHLDIRGTSAEAVLSSAYNTPSLAIGAAVTVADGLLVRLRRDEFMLLAPDLNPALELLASKPAESLITLTDITHGRGVMALSGSRAPDVLPKVCSLDFADAKFRDLHAAQTSLAKVRTLIIRRDTAQTPTYFLIVDRSLMGYVWDVLFDAAQEWGGSVLSQDTLDLLRK